MDNHSDSRLWDNPISDDFCFSAFDDEQAEEQKNCFSIIKMPPRPLVFFFLINAGNFMSGQKIQAINTAMPKAIDLLKKLNSDPEYPFYISSMKISDNPEWTVSFPIPVEDYCWENIKADGTANFNEAFKELNAKLSRNEYLDFPLGVRNIVLVLLSTTGTVDLTNDGIEVLSHNLWYRHSIKSTLFFFDDTDRNENIRDENLLLFIKDSENSYEITNPEQFEEQLLSFINNFEQTPRNII